VGFFRDLTARGLSGVALVTSDAHAGLTGATLPGAARQGQRVGPPSLMSRISASRSEGGQAGAGYVQRRAGLR